MSIHIVTFVPHNNTSSYMIYGIIPSSGSAAAPNEPFESRRCAQRFGHGDVGIKHGWTILQWKKWMVPLWLCQNSY